MLCTGAPSLLQPQLSFAGKTHYSAKAQPGWRFDALVLGPCYCRRRCQKNRQCWWVSDWCPLVEPTLNLCWQLLDFKANACRHQPASHINGVKIICIAGLVYGNVRSQGAEIASEFSEECAQSELLQELETPPQPTKSCHIPVHTQVATQHHLHNNLHVLYPRADSR